MCSRRSCAALPKAAVQLAAATRVAAIRRSGRWLCARTPSTNELTARAVVLATGGRSLPKTGSDGVGYEFARSLGHSLVAQTPALGPSVLDPAPRTASMPRLSGIAVDGELSVWIDGADRRPFVRRLLWTHFGISGPVVMDASPPLDERRTRRAGSRACSATCSPGESFESVERWWMRSAAARPRAAVLSHLARSCRSSVAAAFSRPARWRRPRHPRRPALARRPPGLVHALTGLSCRSSNTAARTTPRSPPGACR